MDNKNSVDLIKSYLDLDRKAVSIKFFFDKYEFENFEISSFKKVRLGNIPEPVFPILACSLFNLTYKL